VILNTTPTVIEFALTAVIVWFQFGQQWRCDRRHRLARRVWFTIRASDWRISIRREMNDLTPTRIPRPSTRS
jgi:ATP-binding cassette subfamily B protein